MDKRPQFATENDVAAEIVRLHQQGLVTAAISIRLSIPSDEVRAAVRAHLKASRPHNEGASEARRNALKKRDKALRQLKEAAAELARLDAR